MGRDAGAWTGTATLLVTTGSGVVAVDADVAVTAAWLATCTAADADTEGGVVCFVSRGGNLSVSFSSTEAAAAADRDSFEAAGAARKWAGAGTCTAATAAGLGPGAAGGTASVVACLCSSAAVELFGGAGRVCEGAGGRTAVTAGAPETVESNRVMHDDDDDNGCTVQT